MQDASVVEWMNMGLLLPDEAQPVSQIQRSLQDVHRRLQIETSALEQELAELTGKGDSLSLCACVLSVRCCCG
jgi:hypothetical protein